MNCLPWYIYNLFLRDPVEKCLENRKRVLDEERRITKVNQSKLHSNIRKYLFMDFQSKIFIYYLLFLSAEDQVQAFVNYLC